MDLGSGRLSVRGSSGSRSYNVHLRTFCRQIFTVCMRFAGGTLGPRNVILKTFKNDLCRSRSTTKGRLVDWT